MFEKHSKGILLIYAAILLTGVIAVRNIPIEEIPEASYPRISILTYWWGASPENVEFYVTSVIERELAKIKDVRKINSYSYDGYSYIYLYFTSDTRMDFAYTRVNEALYQLQGKLPEGVDYPQIIPYMPQEYTEEECLSVGIYSETLDKLELSRLVKDRVTPQITNINGVSGVQLVGIVKREVKIAFNNKFLRTLGLNVTRDILPVLRNYRERYSLGEADEGNLNYTLILHTGLSSLEEIQKLTILTDDGRKFYLGDLADVTWEVSEEGSQLFRLNGNDVIDLLVYGEPGVNVVSLVDEVKQKMENLFSTTPELVLVSYIILNDASEDIQNNINNLMFRILLTAGIIFLVLLFFLRRWRPAIIVLTTIFFDVLITLNVLYFTGQTLNYFTLSGFALAFGLLVDNAIVVYENIHKYQLKKYPYIQAAKAAIKEIRWAIIAATLTTVCVFIPFIYLQPDIQVLLIPFAITVGIALCSSIIVSLTFIPLSIKAFTPNISNEGKKFKQDEKQPTYTGYGKTLEFLLSHRWLPLLIALVIFSYALYIFITDVEKGEFFVFSYPDYVAVYIAPPPNTTLETMDDIVCTFEDIIKDAPENQLKYFYSTITPREAYIVIYFPEEVLETAYPYVLREQLTVHSKYYAGIEVRVWGLGPTFSGGGGIFYQGFDIAGYNYLQLMELAEILGSTIEKNPRVTNVRIGSSWGRQVQQLNIELRHDILENYNVNPAALINQLYYLLNKLEVGKITTYDDEVVIRLEAKEPLDIDELQNLVLGFGNTELKLREVADIKLIGSPYYIRRINQEYITRIEYEFRGPYRMFEEFEETVLTTTHFPEGYHFVEEEEALTEFSKFIENTKDIIFILALTILIVYILLATLFESYTQPFVIMLTLPLAFIGVSFTFALNDLTFDSSAFIGTLLLCGIVVNNAIIMVNRINQIREGNNNLNQAIVAGAKERLRPILMTSITTILGLMPFILYTPEAAGQDIWNILAYATVGGLITATFFTLFIIPVVYNLFEHLKER